MLAVIPAANAGAGAFVKTDADALVVRPKMVTARAASSVWMCLFIARYLPVAAETSAVVVPDKCSPAVPRRTKAPERGFSLRRLGSTLLDHGVAVDSVKVSVLL